MAPKKKQPSRPKQLGRLAASAAAASAPVEPEQPEVQATSSTSLVPTGPPILDLSTASIQELCACYEYARALQQGTPVLLRNPSGWVNGWSDVFDLEAPAAAAWWLSPIPDQPASPLDVDHAQLPTMTARLRVAKAAAAQGTRLGFIKAVALSLDAAGPGPKGWTQKHLALNAINKLLFRRKAYTDAYTPKQAREDFEQLPAAERRLFQQVHAAMNSLDDGEPWAPAVQVNYTTSVAYRGMEQAWYNPSVQGHRHAMLTHHAHQGNFDNVDVFFLGAGDHRLLPHISMTAAYTHLLACYTLKGPDHADTRTALRQARNRDPQGWVPKLLGGIAFPPVSCAPAVAAGSRQEAWGYVRAQWAPWCKGLNAEGEHIEWIAEGQALHWLLQQCQLPMPTSEQQGKLAQVWCVSCYAPECAFSQVEPLALEVHRVFNNTSGPGRVESIRQLGGVGALRNLLVLLCAMAQLTYNLPPIDAAPALWQEVMDRLRWPTVDGARRRVHMCASAMLPVAQHVLRMYEGLTPHQLEGAGAVHPGEVEEMAALLGSLQPVAARWLWQVGDVRAAKQAAVDALGAWQQPKRVTMQWSASHEPIRAAGSSSSSSVGGGGLQYASSWQRIVDFVSAETMAALRGGRLKQRRGGASSSSSSSQGLFATGAADPVFQLPSEWLDELVGWQVGRRVKVCFSLFTGSRVGGPPNKEDGEDEMSATYRDSKGQVEVMLQGSDGRRVDFNWGEEGDANEVKMWKEVQGILDSDEEEEDEEEDWEEEEEEDEGTHQGFSSRGGWLGQPGVSVQQALAQSLDEVMNNIFNPGSNSSAGGRAGPATPAAPVPAAAAAAAGARAAPAGPAKAATPAAASASAVTAAAGASRGAGTATTDEVLVLREPAVPQAPPGPAAAPTQGGSSASKGSNKLQTSSGAAVEAGAGAEPQAQQASTAQQPAPGAGKSLKPCAWCGTQLPKLQKCSRCRKVGYCCKEHQVEHWPTHKQQCAAASAAQ